MLSTLSSRAPSEGFPAGSVVEYVADDQVRTTHGLGLACREGVSLLHIVVQHKSIDEVPGRELVSPLAGRRCW